MIKTVFFAKKKYASSPGGSSVGHTRIFGRLKTGGVVYYLFYSYTIYIPPLDGSSLHA